MVNASGIVKAYFYGSDTITDLNNIDITNREVSVGKQSFMSNGAGRFAVGSQFNFINDFFAADSSSFEVGKEYTKSEILTELGYDLQNDFYGLSMQQYNYQDGNDDYAERVFIYNSMSFKISDGATFSVDTNGNKSISNYAIDVNLPLDSNNNPIPENFDFDSSDTLTQIANLDLKNSIDRYDSGNTVNINFTGNVTTTTYTAADYAADQATQASWTTGLNVTKLLADIGNIVASLENADLTQIIIGTNGADNLLIDNQQDDIPVIATASGNDNIVLPSLNPDGIDIYGGGGSDTVSYENVLFNDGVDIDLNAETSTISTSTSHISGIENLIGSNQSDDLFGNDEENIIEGRNGLDHIKGKGGDDFLKGGNDRDLLEGGEDNDQLDGGLGDLDSAVFSGDYTRTVDANSVVTETGYTIESLGNDTYRITDIDATTDGDDGIDTLTGVEYAKFGNQAPVDLQALFSHVCDSEQASKSETGRNDTSVNLTSDTHLCGDELNYTFSITQDSDIVKAIEKHFVIMLDNSNSLHPDAFAAEQAAGTAYITSNSTIFPDATFSVIAFAGGASDPVPLNAVEATDYIDNLGQSSGTDYAVALNKVSEYLEDMNSNAYKSVLFMSDGGDTADLADRTAAIVRLHAVTHNVKAVNFGNNTANASSMDDIDTSGTSKFLTDSNNNGKIDITEFNDVLQTADIDTSTISSVDIEFNGQVEQTYTAADLALGISSASVGGIIDVSNLAESNNLYSLSATIHYTDYPDASVTLPVSFGLTDHVTSVGNDDTISISFATSDYNAGIGDDTIIANSLSNVLTGGDGDDAIMAGGGDDAIYLGDGHNATDAGEGIDTVYYTGNIADYTISQGGSSTYVYRAEDTVAGTAEINDTLINVELMEFADGVVSTNDVAAFLPELSVNSVSVGEVSSGTSSVELTFNLSAATTNDVTFTYRTVDFTAEAATDYQDKTETITIAAGKMSTSVIFRVQGDTILESNESFRVIVSDVVGASLEGYASETSAYVTILENSASANTDPLSNNDTATVAMNQSVVIDVLGNDSDVEDIAYDASNVSIINGPTNGVIAINSDGTVSYVATTGYSGVDSFTYLYTDSQGATALAPATVDITVQDGGLTLTHVGGIGDDSITGTGGADVMLGNAGNDTLKASSGNDTLMGAAGDDYIEGYKGDDVYVWKAGDGNDTYYEKNTSSSGTDTIEFAGGITLADLDIYGVAGYDIKIVYTPTGETLTVNYGMGASTRYHIEQLSFDDGTLHVFDGYEVRGEVGDDSLKSGYLEDTLYGYEGNDTLDGYAGDDFLYGGLGDDTLKGYKGDDTYVWEAGDGNDFIQESNTSASGTDTILLTGGIVAADITIADVGNDREITHNPTGEVITIGYYDYGVRYRVELIEFDDGTTMSII